MDWLQGTLWLNTGAFSQRSQTCWNNGKMRMDAESGSGPRDTLGTTVPYWAIVTLTRGDNDIALGGCSRRMWLETYTSRWRIRRRSTKVSSMLLREWKRNWPRHRGWIRDSSRAGNNLGSLIRLLGYANWSPLHLLGLHFNFWHC